MSLADTSFCHSSSLTYFPGFITSPLGPPAPSQPQQYPASSSSSSSSASTTSSTSASGSTNVQPTVASVIDPRSAMALAGGAGSDSRGDYYDELWEACAGPLVSLPRLKQLVMYCPQGHIEQITASTGKQGGIDDGGGQELPKHGLEPHILCRVVGLQLSAEAETDEVKAQLSLLPEPQGYSDVTTDEHDESDKEDSPTRPRRVVHMFCKTLTASDTSTHGGFSVPRKHAVCLPPLDMNRYPPTQEIFAKDLHGTKWSFRHIYRGQPKRHLLTTGWSSFVSLKKLQAGDTVIFLRGENDELRVGIRRAMRQPANPSSSVLPSQSMHMAVIATATHAVQTRTMFTVYYKPRLSPAEFIIPLERFKKAVSQNLSVGVRFKMKFETEDSSERRYNGTITGVEDVDPIRWSNSKWRCLKVGWDESTIYERHDRVSPWEIELCVPATSPAPSNNTAALRYKRPRPAGVAVGAPATPERLPAMNHGRSGQAALESYLAAASACLSTVLQGQEPRALCVREDKESGPSSHYHHQNQHMQHHHLLQQQHHQRHVQQQQQQQQQQSQQQQQQQQQQTGWGPSAGQEMYWQMTNGQRSRGDGSTGAGGGGNHPFSSFVCPQQFVSSEASLKMGGRPLQCPSTSMGAPNPRPNSNGQNWQAVNMHNTSSWLVNPLMPPPHSAKTSGLAPMMGTIEKPNPNTSTPHVVVKCQQQPSHNNGTSACPNQSWALKPNGKESCETAPPPPPTPTPHSENSCKLFGVSLTDLSAPKVRTKAAEEEGELDSASAVKQQGTAADSVLAQVAAEHEGDQETSCRNHNMLPENSTISSEQDKSSAPPAKEGKPKIHQVAVRSCTKVVMEGRIVGRGVDLSKFEGYQQLFEELERMFHIELGLRGANRGWQVAYYDNEGDMLLVGDDPWQEFCEMVRKIRILSPDEVEGKKLLDRSHHASPAAADHTPTPLQDTKLCTKESTTKRYQPEDHEDSPV